MWFYVYVFVFCMSVGYLFIDVLLLESFLVYLRFRLTNLHFMGILSLPKPFSKWFHRIHWHVLSLHSPGSVMTSLIYAWKTAFAIQWCLKTYPSRNTRLDLFFTRPDPSENHYPLHHNFCMMVVLICISRGYFRWLNQFLIAFLIFITWFWHFCHIIGQIRSCII